MSIHRNEMNVGASIIKAVPNLVLHAGTCVSLQPRRLRIQGRHSATTSFTHTGAYSHLWSLYPQPWNMEAA